MIRNNTPVLAALAPPSVVTIIVPCRKTYCFPLWFFWLA